MPEDVPVLARARALAEHAHRGQLRKAGGRPYFEHLSGVEKILLDHGYSDPLILAVGYLHDVLEDQPASADRLRREMPPEVVAAVELLTESKTDVSGRKRPKAERFAEYAARLAAAGNEAELALPVSCADKIHNWSSLVETEAAGESLLSRLATRPGDYAEQHARLRRVFHGRVNARLLRRFDQAAEDLQRTISNWLPGRAAMLAAEANLGRFDAHGEPAIFSVLRVASKLDKPLERLTWLLQDALRLRSLEELSAEGFPEEVVRALPHVAHREEESEEEWLRRLSEQRLAARIVLLHEKFGSEAHLRLVKRLEAELAKRSLWVVLDRSSVDCVRRMSLLPVVRGDHVTLAHRVDPHRFAPEWVPGGHRPGERVALRAVSQVCDERLQALALEMAGSTHRPFDGGPLHLTVSRVRGARSREANSLLERAPRQRVDLELSGQIVWVEA
ncbi:MAG TPA: HD domain-containing protein [Polyangiaceae bacterium]|nr:HD domain-containing protein [Polyangiaceae bacterium]